ncbi:MAG TPA: phosphatase PAP2 family protein [Bryobacteraceae bacterium]|nr:phosphatase PAP2 family protein [Bryobacteraceae bacterium]
MKPRFAIVVFFAALPLLAQQNSQQSQPAAPNLLGAQPGTPPLQNPDLYQGQSYWRPFGRMAKFVLRDQKAIWPSPFHTSESDIKYWAIFGGSTLGLIFADQHIAHAAPDTPGLRTLGTSVSYLGAFYTVLPLTGGFYFLGTAAGDQRFRETGLLGFETLANTGVVLVALKAITDRERPKQGSLEGHFEEGPSRLNSSFPSGHAASAFALASVFAHEYHDKTWVKVLAYAYAAGVCGARLAANQHFPGDTLAGGAIGWFIGDYVYATRHNPALDGKSTLPGKILAHVRIGPGF